LLFGVILEVVCSFFLRTNKEEKNIYLKISNNFSYINLFVMQQSKLYEFVATKKFTYPDLGTILPITEVLRKK
jgi:hypothetical protein